MIIPVRRVLWSVVAVLFTAGLLLIPVSVLAAQPMVKIEQLSKSTVRVGQKILVAVDLYSPTFFSGVPRFDLPEVSGMVIMKVPGRPVMSSEQFGDDYYSVQRHEFFIYPQRAGKFNVPPFPVQFGVAGVGMAKPTRHTLKTTPLTFQAKMPPGAEHLATLISANDLEVKESWSNRPESPMVGDAFSRVISFRAPDIPGMAFPPIPPMKVPGLAIYPDAARVNDKTFRGNLVGERSETITYVCETEGKILIPALVFHWWELSSGRLKRIEFPAVELNVAPDPDLVQANVAVPPPEQETRDRLSWLIVAGLLLPLVVLFLLRHRIAAMSQRRRERHLASEDYAFARLVTACRQQDPALTLKLFWHWMERLPPEFKSVTLEDFARTFKQEQLDDELQALQQAVLDRRDDWRGALLLRCLKSARETMTVTQAKSVQDLPALNPRRY